MVKTAWVAAEANPKRSTRHVVSKVASVLFITMLAALVGIVLVLPRVLGAVPLTVLSGSMTPTLRPGDIVVVRPTPVAELRVGDVITFQPVSGDPSLTTHRIVQIIASDDDVQQVITRGDANNVDDDPIIPAQINGQVIYSVPFVGYLTTTRNAALAAATLVGGALVIYAVRGIVVAWRSRDDYGEIQG